MTELRDDTRRSTLERILGDRPGAVVTRLVILSLVVGFFMVIFGFSAMDLVDGIVRIGEEAMRDSAGLIRQIGVYLLTGATVVVPIWLLLRLTRRRR